MLADSKKNSLTSKLKSWLWCIREWSPNTKQQ